VSSAYIATRGPWSNPWQSAGACAGSLGGEARIDNNCSTAMPAPATPLHPLPTITPAAPAPRASLDGGPRRQDLWYGSPVRLLLVLALLLASTACRAPLIQSLPLQWRDVDGARPSPSVSLALQSVPISLGVRDVRADPTVVGTDVDTGHVVQTPDNVAQFTSTAMGELMRAAGARLDEPPLAAVEIDLTEFNCDEAGKFNAAVGFRAILRRGEEEVWTKGFRGTASTWGKTHNPDNFNKALSNALDEATESLLQDEDFANALMQSVQAPLPPPPAAPPAPPSQAPAGQ
jgi:uncharacterized lipoprotein YajG